jgi:hypothetical protein
LYFRDKKVVGAVRFFRAPLHLPLTSIVNIRSSSSTNHRREDSRDLVLVR